MTHQIYPCLWFDGQAKAAADFYCSIFHNSKITAHNPIVTTFELNENKIMALNGGPMFKINPSISLFVKCESVNETDALWNHLIESGNVLMPIDKYDWSKRYGWLQDKFGVTWQIMVHNIEGTKQTITPSLLFTHTQFGKGEEALEFYTSVFENSSVTKLERYPNETPFSGKLMYSEFSLNHYKLIAMDGPNTHDYTFNEAVSFVVNCDTQQEIDYYWNTFTKDGQESMCGWLKDKYGVSWQIVPSVLGKLMSDPEKAQQVVQVFLKMKKFDIEQLLKA